MEATSCPLLSVQPSRGLVDEPCTVLVQNLLPKHDVTVRALLHADGSKIANVNGKIQDMMEQAGNSRLLTVLSYPKTGHLIEPPYSPHVRASNFMATGKPKVVVLWGGETAPLSKAQEHAWTRILDFLRENLYGDAGTALL